jgi:hypothetical protein
MVLVTLIVVGDVARMTARTWGSHLMTPLWIGVDYHYTNLSIKLCPSPPQAINFVSHLPHPIPVTSRHDPTNIALIPRHLNFPTDTYNGEPARAV